MLDVILAQSENVVLHYAKGEVIVPPSGIIRVVDAAVLTCEGAIGGKVLMLDAAGVDWLAVHSWIIVHDLPPDGSADWAEEGVRGSRPNTCPKVDEVGNLARSQPLVAEEEVLVGHQAITQTNSATKQTRSLTFWMRS